MRLNRSLVDGWQLVRDAAGPAVVAPTAPGPPVDGWRSVVVPGFWQSQFPEWARATGPVWYRVGFELDDEWFEPDVRFVRFGAVGHYCQGWLNGSYLGDHDGGHLPFEWPLGDTARAGRNELLVRVVSPSGDRARYPDFPFEETLHGKQSWYGPTGGIWQEVEVEARSAIAIEQLDISTDVEHDTLTVRVDLARHHPPAEVLVEIIDSDGSIVARRRAEGSGPLGLDAESLRRWSLTTPHLYVARVSLIVDGRVVDVAEQRFGVRSFVADDGRFLLNDQPILMRGVLDQDWYDASGVPASKQALVDRFSAIKAMGFNTLRCHIKVPDPHYLDAADEVGLLVWGELPSTTRLTQRARERIVETLDGMIARDRHHPSVVIWGIANEDWGFDLVGNAEHRAWLRELYHRAKAAAPDRLIVDNSPCAPNFHVETDVEDYHFYAVYPEMRDRWDRFLAAFTERATFTFSPNGDTARSGREPLVVSEFGAWGLPDLSDLEDDEPWWFESGQEWADGAAYVHGARTRFALWHLDEVFGSWAGLCRETQRRQFETMEYQIESMRLQPEIAGYVLTELNDVHWEANGLLDMVGRPRTFIGRLAGLNRSTALVARTDRTAIWDDEVARLELTAVNDETPRASARLSWSAGEGSPVAEAGAGRIGAGVRRSFGPVTIEPASQATPSTIEITCSFEGDGELLGTSRRAVTVFPRTAPQLDPDERLVVRDEALAAHITAMGYAVTNDRHAPGLRVLHRLDDDDHDFIEAGGRALLLADDVDALGAGFGEFPRVELAAWRDALFLGGEWVSAFPWLRRSERFADLPGGPLMDAVFERVAPGLVITGIPPARFEHDVLAGVFVGWVHQVAALIARHGAGLGSLLVCTLQLTRQPPDEDPLASWLLHQLVATAWEQQ